MAKKLFGVIVLPEGICTPITASMIVLLVTVKPEAPLHPQTAEEEYAIVLDFTKELLAEPCRVMP